ncbi:hypothetical protein FOZ61_009439 [Perkinsus olseni]|nr:hypothetical protein FOZ61_009439 [Perkinsus olseni]
MARLCVHYNRQAVASQLLLSLDHRGQQQQQSEGPSGEVVPAASEQTVGLLLSLGSVPLALRKAVEVGSPDSIQRCIASIIGSSVDMEDTANDIVQACKEADLTPPENVLVAALVLDRWREEQDRRSGVLRNDDSIKIILRDLVGSSAVAQHSAAVALRTAIAAPVAEASKEDASGGGGRWWSRLGRSDRTSDQSRVLTRSDAADMFRNVGGEFSAVYGTTREASAQQSAVILQEESDLCRRQAQLERLSAMRGWTGAAGNKFVGLSMWETVRRLVTIGEVEEARGLLTKAKLLPEYNRRWWKVAVDALVNARRFSELAQMAEAAARSAGPPIGFEPIVALLLENQQFDLARGLVGKCKDMEQVASFYETLGMREEAMKAQQLAEQQRRSAIGGTSLLTGWSSTIAGAMRGGFTRS